jgi:riboflavin-specific deaminase-like protein
VADDGRDVVLAWLPGTGWESRLPASDPRAELLSLYLPICSATSTRPLTIGHLGQSLDGFIATPSGDSQTVTGDDNIIHLHRLRALCDAVLVGAGTVAADDPLLTTRHVSGASPLRVVFDPRRRLAPDFRVFTDRGAPALYICARSRISPGESHIGTAVIAPIDGGEPGDEVAQALRLLHGRGCARVLVEGGGVTVSKFLEANLLGRLHIAVAPVLIGDGRPAVRLAPQVRLRDCRRPSYRVFRMGGDVLFDCDLTAGSHSAQDVIPGTVNRII